ncbi:MAG: hypothetical protein IJZ61_03480 [Oscillospiraceae bacterium]|nr:hypothetical protein [Oscillospiraceae bacterium]
MAFCQFCGKEVAEGEACGCASEREVMESEKVAEAKTSEAAESKPVNSKAVIIAAAIAAAAIFITLIVLLIVSIGSGGYKKPVEQLVKAVNKGSGEILVEATCTDKMLRYFDKEEDMEYEDVCDEFDDMIDDFVDELEDEYGDNIKLSVKFEDKYELDEDEIEEIEDQYKRMGYRTKIDKAYELECTFTIKGEDDDDEDDADIIVIKVKGEGWKLYVNSVDNIM